MLMIYCVVLSSCPLLLLSLCNVIIIIMHAVVTSSFMHDCVCSLLYSCLPFVATSFLHSLSLSSDLDVEGDGSSRGWTLRFRVEVVVSEGNRD